MKINKLSLGLSVLGGLAMMSNPVLGVVCVGAAVLNHKWDKRAIDAGTTTLKDILDGKYGEDMKQGMINTINNTKE